MIRRAEECSVSYAENLKGGQGTAINTSFIADNSELMNKGRLFGKLHLDPGCSLGYHVHEGDSELYYITKGSAEYNDNGSITTVKEGDVTICKPGCGHGIANNTDEPMELIAVIVFQ